MEHWLLVLQPVRKVWLIGPQIKGIGIRAAVEDRESYMPVPLRTHGRSIILLTPIRILLFQVRLLRLLLPRLLQLLFKGLFIDLSMERVMQSLSTLVSI